MPNEVGEAYREGQRKSAGPSRCPPTSQIYAACLRVVAGLSMI